MWRYNRTLRHKDKWKEIKFKFKAVTMIYPVTEWFEITQYDDKIVISIVKLVETMWMFRYPRPMEITYDQESQFIGHEFRKSLIEI